MNMKEKIKAARERMEANGAGGALSAATRAAKQRDEHIGTRVSNGMLEIIRATPRKGSSHDIKVLAGPMLGWQAVEVLNNFANNGNI